MQEELLMGNQKVIILLLVIFSLGAIIIACSDESGDDDDDDDDNNADDDDSNGDDDDENEDVWTDSNTGLMWQMSPPIDDSDWHEARNACNGLSLGGHDDWRLPTIGELRSLVRDCPKTEPGGDCLVDDGCVSIDPCHTDACWGCAEFDGPKYWPSELKGYCTEWVCEYWSSTVIPDSFGNASVWVINFNKARIEEWAKVHTHRYRCVRGSMEESDDDDDDNLEDEVWTDPETQR